MVQDNNVDNAVICTSDELIVSEVKEAVFDLLGVDLDNVEVKFQTGGKQRKLKRGGGVSSSKMGIVKCKNRVVPLNQVAAKKITFSVGDNPKRGTLEETLQGQVNVNANLAPFNEPPKVDGLIQAKSSLLDDIHNDVLVDKIFVELSTENAVALGSVNKAFHLIINEVYGNTFLAFELILELTKLNVGVERGILEHLKDTYYDQYWKFCNAYSPVRIEFDKDVFVEFVTDYVKGDTSLMTTSVYLGNEKIDSPYSVVLNVDEARKLKQTIFKYLYANRAKINLDNVKIFYVSNPFDRTIHDDVNWDESTWNVKPFRRHYHSRFGKVKDTRVYLEEAIRVCNSSATLIGIDFKKNEPNSPPFKHNFASHTSGGGRKLTRTSEKVTVKNRLRTVYMGPRGGKYVKIANAYISLKNI